MTMIEIMVVVSILGLMAAIAVPNLLPLVHAGKLSGASLQLAGFIESARARALAEGRCYRVRVAGSSMIVERRTGTDCVTLSKEGWQGPLRTLPLPGVIFSIDATTTDAFDGANNRMIFRPSGRLRGDGDLLTTDDHARVTITIPGIADRATVEVMASGRICTQTVATVPAIAVLACP